MREKFSFRIRLAGVTIEIRTSYDNLKVRMKDYILEENGDPSPFPSFTVDLSDQDREEMLRILRLVNGEDFACSESYLEFIAVHTAIGEKILDDDVMLMHGSAICMDGQAYIFTAPSGTGKSTHSRLWREAFGSRAFMVNDDKPMLLCHKDGIYVCGTPWMGKHSLGENVSVKLKAIAFLERGETNSIEPVRPADVFQFLYLQTYRSKDPQKEAKALELLSRISSNVSMYRLRCNMDPEAALISYQGMQK